MPRKKQAPSKPAASNPYAGLLTSPPTGPREKMYPQWTTIRTLAAKGPAGVKAIAAAHGHIAYDSAMGLRQAEAAAADFRASQGTSAAKPKTKTVQSGFSRGRIVRHKLSGQKVTIMAAAVKRNDAGTKVHRVAFKNGEEKLVPETNLELL